jgi:hypothetical protein
MIKEKGSREVIDVSPVAPPLPYLLHQISLRLGADGGSEFNADSYQKQRAPKTAAL